MNLFMIKNNYRFTLYACYLGYVTQAIVNNFLPLIFLILSRRFGISLTQITFLITVNFLVQLTVDLISAKFVDKIGYRISIVTAHICSVIGLIGIGLLPFIMSSPYMGLIISVVIYAVGGGLIEVLISPIAEACPTENKASVMSLLHSFYCWGTVAVILVTTILLRLPFDDCWRFIAFFWAVVPLINCILFSFVPIGSLTEDGTSLSVKELFSNNLFPVFVVLMVCSGASELAMSQWASAFAESALNVSKTTGDLAGPCLFSVLMGSARVLYAKFSHKIKLSAVLMGSGALCVVSYLASALSPNPVIALAGCALCGLSVGILWPGVFSLASASIPKGGTLMFALLALAGDIGCSGGPTLVGILSDGNLKNGLIYAIIFPVILIAFTLIYRKISQKYKTKKDC